MLVFFPEHLPFRRAHAQLRTMGSSNTQNDFGHGREVSDCQTAEVYADQLLPSKRSIEKTLSLSRATDQRLGPFQVSSATGFFPGGTYPLLFHFFGSKTSLSLAIT